MGANRVGWTALSLMAVAFVALTGPRAIAQTRIVSPPAAESAEGAISVTPSRLPLRIQYLIPASEFAGLPATHRRLASFNFRSDAAQTTPVDWLTPHEQVWMSTTSVTSLSTTFDANHGADKTLVHDGQMTYFFLGTGPPAGPRPFADGQRLQTPFYYDPSQGNLLVELRDFDKNYPTPVTIDLFTIPGSTIRTMFNEGDASAATGLAVPDVAAPIRFEFVPEPTACALACVAFFGLLRVRRTKSDPRVARTIAVGRNREQS